jgi:hypothetical protein
MKLIYTILLILCASFVSAKPLAKDFNLAVLPPTGPNGELTALSDYFANMAGDYNTAEAGKFLKNSKLNEFLHANKWPPTLIPDYSLLQVMKKVLTIDYLIVGTYEDIGMHFKLTYQAIDIKTGLSVKEHFIVLKKDLVVEKMQDSKSKWESFVAQKKAEGDDGWGTPLANKVEKKKTQQAHKIKGCYVGTLVLCRIEIQSSTNDNAEILENHPETLCETSTGKELKVQLDRITTPATLPENRNIYAIQAELLFSPVNGSSRMGKYMGKCKIKYKQSGKEGFISLDNQRFRRK